MVETFLEERKADSLLNDKLLPVAVCPIQEVDSSTGERLPREQINTAVKDKRQGESVRLAKGRAEQ